MSDDDFNTQSAVFLDWLGTLGVTMSPKMALVDLRSQGRGRGVVATEDFDEDEVVFSIPRTSVLNLKNWIPAQGDLPSGITTSALTELPSWLALTIVMIIESQKQASLFSPYFSVLPKSLDTLTFWSPAELKELQASAVVHKIGKEGAEKLYNEHVAPLGLEGVNLDLFHHVASVIMAYAFDIPEENQDEKDDGDEEFVEDDEEDGSNILLSMVPLADMLNADAELNNARLSSDSEELEMRTIKPIKKGEEILNDYGLLPRSALLRRYGYITEQYTPFDVCEISTEAILSAAASGKILNAKTQPLNLKPEQIEGRTQLAEREDVFEESYDVGYADEDGPSIPDELIALVFLLVSDKEILQKVNNSSLPSRSRMATEDVGAVLGQIFRLRESEYPTTLEEDEKLLAEGVSSDRLRMAIEVRLGEKRVLRSALQEASKFWPQERAKGKRSGDSDAHAAKKVRHN